MTSEVQLMGDNDKWAQSAYGTRKEWAKMYPDAILITTSHNYYYYYAVKSQLLYRISKSIPIPQKMTKKEAEEEYNIEIED